MYSLDEAQERHKSVHGGHALDQCLAGLSDEQACVIFIIINKHVNIYIYIISLSLYLSLSLYIYIYIYIERERYIYIYICTYM